MTDEELLTEYIKEQFCDPLNEDARKIFKESSGFAWYALGVRWNLFIKGVGKWFRAGFDGDYQDDNFDEIDENRIERNVTLSGKIVVKGSDLRENI